MIKNFIFDFGNVLTKYDISEYIEKLCGERRDGILNYVFTGKNWKMFDAGLIDHEQMKALAKSEAPQHYHDTIDTLIDTFPEAFEQYDEMLPVLKKLKESGYKTFLLSNFPKGSYEQTAKNCPILDFIDEKVVSYKLHIAKPDKEIFEYVLDEYGLCANECLFADDYEINVNAARSLGINGHVFTTADEFIKCLRSFDIEI